MYDEETIMWAVLLFVGVIILIAVFTIASVLENPDKTPQRSQMGQMGASFIAGAVMQSMRSKGGSRGNRGGGGGS